MKPQARFFKLFFIVLASSLIFFISCEPEPEPDTNSNSNNSNTIDNLSPDELSDHLVLKNSTKIIGTLPQASAGNLKINMKDTIYLVKGKSFGTRIEVKHDGLYEITGFYVGVSNSSFYFDVPIVEEESGETTDVFIFYVEDPEGLDFPFSFPVTILPHVNGIPVKKFVRIVTKEDPEDKEMCSPIIPAPVCFEDNVTKEIVCQCKTACWSWIWEFTVVEDNSGDIYRAYAPAMFISEQPSAHGGCCYMGISIPAKDDPYCQSANPEYREVVVDDQYYVRYFEALDLFDNGVYERWMRTATKNYSPDESNYCSGEAGYLVNDSFTKETGTHDFSETSDRIRFTTKLRWDVNDPSSVGGGWTIGSGDLQYTCHSLIVSFPFVGGKWSVVYRRSDVDFNPLETYFPEYYE